MKNLPFYVVNSFAERPFGGNPAAVFTDGSGLEPNTMQAIAKQMNLVETVFVFPAEGADFRFRYFTPEEELPVAGHPTIAAAFALRAAGIVDNDRIRQYGILTGKGECMVGFEGSGESAMAFMRQPEPVFGKAEERRGLVADVLGIAESDMEPGLPIAPVDTGLGHLIVPLKSTDALFRIRRNLDPLYALCHDNGVREAQVFTLDQPENDLIKLQTRNICPREGMEDPACGTGTAALGSYLMRYYCPHRNYAEIKAEQGEIVRMPSVIHVKATRRSGSIEISIGGKGKVMIKGELFI